MSHAPKEERLDAWFDGSAVCVIAVGSYGDPLDLSDHEVEEFVSKLQAVLRVSSGGEVLPEACQDPRRTLQLLSELETIGFPDSAFAIVHHLDKPETIRAHRAYCEELIGRSAMFCQGINRLVQQRLELLASMARLCGHHSPELFGHLARAAVVEVPHA